MTATMDSGLVVMTGPEQYTRHNAPDVEGPQVSREEEYEVVLIVKVKGFGTEKHQEQTAYSVAKHLTDAMSGILEAGEKPPVLVYRTERVNSTQSTYRQLEVVRYDARIHDGHHPKHTPWWEKERPC